MWARAVRTKTFMFPYCSDHRPQLLYVRKLMSPAPMEKAPNHELLRPISLTHRMVQRLAGIWNPVWMANTATRNRTKDLSAMERPKAESPVAGVPRSFGTGGSSCFVR